MKRILGQCHQSDITFIEHLVRVAQTRKEDILDYETLTKNQRIALLFVKEALEKGVPWKLIRNAVREVLVWEAAAGEPGSIEVKFFPKREEAQKFMKLWRAS